MNKSVKLVASVISAGAIGIFGNPVKLQSSDAMMTNNSQTPDEKFLDDLATEYGIESNSALAVAHFTCSALNSGARLSEFYIPITSDRRLYATIYTYAILDICPNNIAALRDAVNYEISQ